MTAQNVADILNDALKLDPAVLNTLFHIRRVCGKSIADHPHIQVWGPTENGPFWLSFLGLLNGMLRAGGSEEIIVMSMDDDKNMNIVGFTVKNYDEYIKAADKRTCSSSDSTSATSSVSETPQ